MLQNDSTAVDRDKNWSTEMWRRLVYGGFLWSPKKTLVLLLVEDMSVSDEEDVEENEVSRATGGEGGGGGVKGEDGRRGSRFCAREWASGSSTKGNKGRLELRLFRGVRRAVVDEGSGFMVQRTEDKGQGRGQGQGTGAKGKNTNICVSNKGDMRQNTRRT